MQSATCNSRGFCRDFDNNHCEGCMNYETERKQIANKFTIKDIKSGYIVKLRNGDLFMAMRAGDFEKIFCNDIGSYYLASGYNEKTLKRLARYDNEHDIVEVYGLVEKGYYHKANNLSIYHRPLLWKRSEPVKMTVEEINEKLGYEVEIVANTERR